MRQFNMTLLVVSQCYLASPPSRIHRRSPCTRKWRANCDTLWTVATEIKSRRGRRFVDVRGNIQVCRSFRRRASTRHATSTGTLLKKHLSREQRKACPCEEVE